MSNEFELWKFVHARLQACEPVMLLVVAESTGSSPGRAGYKMAVGADGQLCGSIGGGVMEVNLVEHSRSILARSLQKPARSKGEMANSSLIEQFHRRDVLNSSGMICSGKQTVIFKLITAEHANVVKLIIEALRDRQPDVLAIAANTFGVEPPKGGTPNKDFQFEGLSDADFTYEERLGFKNDLYIVGGGHCALALSELMSRIDFHISIFDDRPELNTIEKNEFADAITIIDTYENIGGLITSGDNKYVVVMTLGYASDEVVIRQLLDKDLKYFGVLGSTAKMATLLKELKSEGFDPEKLARIHTPVGIPINSHTPEEIAVSIAAEIISVKNASA